jgi:hypothetical protein
MLHRKSGIFTSRNVSGFFSPKLTSTDEKVHLRRSSDPTKYSVLASPDARLSKDSERAGSLSNAFAAAVLAELPTEPYLILENKYPALRSLRTDADIGDGLWICCRCHHENILRHWKGQFPFKYLRCDRCNRQLCSDCHTSEVLTPWPVGIVTARRPAAGQEVRYCHVCSNCGLTHRAEMEGMTLDFYGVTCAGCGRSSYGDWPRYHIGSVEPYRRDPDSSFVRLVMARVDDAAKLSFLCELADLESRPESRLNCRNPG